VRFRLVGAMASAFLACALPFAAAAADRWAFVGDPNDLKFGFRPAGSSHFETLWFQCDSDTKKILVSAAVGTRRPSAGRASATLSAGTQSATIAGEVGEFDFDGVYAIEAELPRGHPVFALLISGQPLSYAAPGWRRPKLAASGQKASTERFLAACR
jgi:hypothetical protein